MQLRFQINYLGLSQPTQFIWKRNHMQKNARRNAALYIEDKSIHVINSSVNGIILHTKDIITSDRPEPKFKQEPEPNQN